MISWFLSKNLISHDDFIMHSAPDSIPKVEYKRNILFKKNGLPLITNSLNYIKFLVKTVSIIFRSVIRIFLGKWMAGLMLREAIKYIWSEYSDIKSIAKAYYFHNSGWIYRPIWTHLVESKGARIVFYYYSYNCMNFKSIEGERQINYGIETMTWTNYLLWDEQHNLWLQRYNKHPKSTSITGPVWFSDSEKEQIIEEDALMIFDIPPFKESISLGFGLDMELHLPSGPIKFLEDILKISKKYGIKTYIKSKRLESNPNIDKRYISLLNNYSKSGVISLVDSKISADKLISRCKATINYPFTSTGIISFSQNKPTIYYDPTNFFHPYAVSSVECIGNEKILEDWIKETFNY